MVVERHKKDLAAVIGDAARYDVAARDALSSAILVWNVGPLEIAGRRIQREHLVWVGADDIKRVADDEWRGLLSVLGADREHPGGLQLADIRRVDLVERAEAGVGVVPRRHHPLFWILGESDEIVTPRRRRSTKMRQPRQETASDPRTPSSKSKYASEWRRVFFRGRGKRRVQTQRGAERDDRIDSQQQPGGHPHHEAAQLLILKP